MKNKFLIFICSVFLILICSCSNAFNSSKKASDGKAFVSFSIHEVSARTMMPDFTDVEFEHLVLYGEMPDSNGEYKNKPSTLGEWFTTSSKTCKEQLEAAELELYEGIWKFTLYAYSENEGYSFGGSTVQEISEKIDNLVSFKLHVNGISPTTGDGGHFNAKFFIPDEVEYVTAGLSYGTEKMSDFGKDYIIGSPDGSGIYKDSNWYFGQIPLEIKKDTAGKQFVEYSDSTYSQKNDGRTGLPNGTYIVWVRMFLNEDDFITFNGIDYDTWGGEYREFLWIADGKTTTAERTLKLKYDGCLAGLDIRGTLPGLTVSLTYENGTPADSLIPDSYKQKNGYKFTGFLDENGKEVTVLDQSTNGKIIHAYYYLSMTIPKFVGQNGEADLIAKTWDDTYINSKYGKVFEQPYSMLQSNDNKYVITHLLKTTDTNKLCADFVFDDNCVIDSSVTGVKNTSQTHYYLDDKILAEEDIIFSNITQTENNSTAHIAANDYLYSDGYTGSTTDYTLKHSAGVLKFKLSGLPVDEVFKKMVLYVPGERIRCEMTDIGYDDKEKDYKICWENEELVERYNHYFLKLGPDGTGMTPAADGTFTLYSILPPKDYSGKTIICTLVDQFDRNYVCYFDDGLNIEEGKLYPMSGTPVLIDSEYIFKINNGGNGWRNTQVSVCNQGGYSPEDLGDFIASNDVSYPLSLSDVQKHVQAFLESPDITWEWGTSHGVKGCFATGIEYSSGEEKTVFIPANGWILKTFTEGTIHRAYKGFGQSCNYWIGTQVPETDYIYCMFGDEDDPGVMGYFDKNTNPNEQMLFSYRDITYDN